MPREVFKPTISVVERSNTVSTLEPAVSGIGSQIKVIFFRSLGVDNDFVLLTVLRILRLDDM